MRTKGHIFAVPPHFAGRLRIGALITLTVLQILQRSIGSRYNGLTHTDLLFTLKSEFLQQSIRATFDSGLLWRLPAYDLAFSIS